MFKFLSVAFIGVVLGVTATVFAAPAVPAQPVPIPLPQRITPVDPMTAFNATVTKVVGPHWIDVTRVFYNIIVETMRAAVAQAGTCCIQIGNIPNDPTGLIGAKMREIRDVACEIERGRRPLPQ